jgi:hypothetical protein
MPMLFATSALPLPAPPIAPALPDPAASAVVRAVELRDRRGTDLDGALSLFARRARAIDEPVERMLARLEQLLHGHVRPLRPDDDPNEVVALVMRRAITAYYRD